MAGFERKQVRLARPTHHIRRLTLNCTVHDLDAALALRARVEDLARALLPPVLERVFDAVAPAGIHLRLDRLDLDLGTIPPSRLERDVPAALERALSEALAGALAAARQAPRSGGRLMTAEEALLDRFDAYLASGTVPSGGASFDPAEDVHLLLAEQPAALAALLRRRAADRHALERLVLQAGAAGLRGLLGLLAPSDAAVILTYLADLLRLHRAAPALPMTAPALERRLWLLTLDYLLRDAGTRFNRRAYLKALVANAAQAEGVAYGALLFALRAAAIRTRRRQPLGDSLPALLDELAGELPAGPVVADASPDDAFALAEAGDIAPMLALLRRDAANPAALAAMVARLDTAVFARLVRALEPRHAALVLAYVGELTTAHRAEALLALSDGTFEPLLRLVVLRLLLRDAGSQFNRRSWLRRLLKDLAASRNVPYERLLAMLTGAIRRLRAHLPPSASLPALVRDLAAERPGGWAAHAWKEPRAWIPPGDRAEAADRAVARRMALPQLRGSVALHSRRAALRRLLREVGVAERSRLAKLLAAPVHGTAARRTGAPPPCSLPALVGALATDDPAAWRRLAERTAAADRAALLRWLAQDAALLRRCAAALTDGQRDAWLAALDPAGRAGVRDTLGALRRLHAEWPVLLLDRAAFARRAWTLAVQAMTRDGGRPADPAGLAHALIAGLAREGSATAADLAAAWRRRSASLPLPEAEAPDPFAGLEGFLRTGEPPAAGAALPGALERDPAGLAALLRQLSAARPGRTAELVERLTGWLPPEDIVECLHPGRAAAAARWAAALSAKGRRSDAAAWSLVLDRVLRGGTVPEPPAGPAFAEDRATLLRHWLDRGAIAPWAPPGASPASLLDDLAEGPLADVLILFGDADAERNAERLRRAADRLGRARAEALLLRLAPWAFAPDGPLARRLAGLTAAERDDLRTRAAAAALAGAPFDLGALATPVMPRGPATEDDGAAGPADRDALFALLSGSGRPPARADRLARLAVELADAGDPAFDAAMRAGLARGDARAGWVAVLPDEVLARLVHRLAPGRARLLLDLTTVLAAAWRRAAAPDRRGGARAMAWTRLLATLAEPSAPTAHAAAGRLLAGLDAGDPAATAGVLSRAREFARDGGYAGLSAVLRPRPARLRTLPSRRDAGPLPDAEAGETLYVGNAGLILFNPFLPHFLERLGLLGEDGNGVPRVLGHEAASRAVHLLQYLVDERCDRPEPQLVLNKLLCGLVPATPVARAITPDAADIAVCDEMIRAVIGNWAIIRNTSPDGLRETFLRREGRLQRGGDHWTVTVQRKTVDILVDQIPWNRSIIYHRWMAGPIHVAW